MWEIHELQDVWSRQLHLWFYIYKYVGMPISYRRKACLHSQMKAVHSGIPGDLRSQVHAVMVFSYRVHFLPWIVQPCRWCCLIPSSQSLPLEGEQPFPYLNWHAAMQEDQDWMNTRIMLLTNRNKVLEMLTKGLMRPQNGGCWVMDHCHFYKSLTFFDFLYRTHVHWHVYTFAEKALNRWINSCWLLKTMHES